MVNRTTKTLFIISLILSFFCGRLHAQTTTHQRLGVEAEDLFELSVGATTEMLRSDTRGSAGVELDPSVSIDFLFRQRFGLSIEAPASLWLALARDAVPRVVGAIGDPSIVTSYTFRLSDWRLGVELSYSHPFGLWNPYQTAEKRIASGSGYRKLGAVISAIRYLDPLVAGIRVGADTCFPRVERSGTSTRPLILTMNLFATEALNGTVALSGSLGQKLFWPLLLNGVSSESGMNWSLSGSVSLIFSERERTLRLGISKLLSDYTSPVTFSMGVSYTFKKKE